MAKQKFFIEEIPPDAKVVVIVITAITIIGVFLV